MTQGQGGAWDAWRGDRVARGDKKGVLRHGLPLAVSLRSLIGVLKVPVIPPVSALGPRFLCQRAFLPLPPPPPFLWSVWSSAGCVLCVADR